MNMTMEENYSFSYSARKSKWRMVIKIIALALGIFIFALGVYFGWKIYTVGERISIHNESASLIESVGSVVSSLMQSQKMLRGEQEGRINILLLGTAGKGKAGQNLTDTVMVMSVNTDSKKVAFLSLPRDFYARIPDTNYATKINSMYQYGLNNGEDVQPLKKTVEEITGLSMHYFVILNFDGFTKIINNLGGINVDVEYDMYDPRYPGPNYSYETFEIKKGLQNLDGATALKYVRERHADPQGDFGRSKRQQKVMESVKNKVFSASTFLNPVTLNSLLTTLGDNVKTDIALDEIESFIALSKQVDTQNINNAVVDAWNKDSLMKVSHLMFNNIRAFILVPRVGNYSEIQEQAQNIFNLDKIKERSSFIAKEQATIALVNQSGDRALGAKVKSLLKEKLKLNVTELITPYQKGSREQTVVYDTTAGEKIFTLDELLKKLPAKLTSDKNDIINVRTGAEIIVLVGSDLKPIYQFEEDSIEDLKNMPDSQEYFNLIENQ